MSQQASPLPRRRFYMMRHGESTDNAQGLFSGAARDPELTEKGVAQAQAARELLERLDPVPERVVVTELLRTHQTAAHATGRRDFTVEPGLNERNLGDLDGRHEQDMKTPPDGLPGEEPRIAHRARVVAALDRQLQDPQTALFVAHAGTMRRVLSALGLEEQTNIGNAQVYECLPTPGKWEVYALSLEQDKIIRRKIRQAATLGI